MRLLRYTIPVSLGLHLMALLALRAEPVADLRVHWGETSVEIDLAPSPEILDAAPLDPEVPDVVEQPPEEPEPEDIPLPEPPLPEPLPAPPPSPPVEIDAGLEEATALEGNEPPLYPAGARRRSAEGQLTLRLKIDDRGQVVEATVAISSGVEAFDKAALKALSTWKFNPARKGNRPVASELLIPVEFRMKD